MTHIVSPDKFKSKKAFKEAVEADPSKVYVDDPAIMGAVSGYVSDVMRRKTDIFVTNHPKRSWFAHVTHNAAGKIIVK